MPTPIDMTGAFTPITPGPPKARAKGDLFSSESFLKLLSKQLTNQDPLEPMKDADFLAQMAQFSSLEMTTKLSQSMAALNATSQLSQGAALIGKRVAYAEDGRPPV